MEHVAALVHSSHAYCHAGLIGIPFLTETAATIRHITEHLNANRLVHWYPQLFWVAVALCQADTIQIYMAGLNLLQTLVRRWGSALLPGPGYQKLHVGRLVAQNWHRPFKGLQQLIIRGLSDHATEDLALTTLRASVSVQKRLPAGADPFFDEAPSRPAVLVGCLLPWLCQQIEMASAGKLAHNAVQTANELAEMCIQCGLSKLSRFLRVLADSNFSNAEVFLERVRKPLCDALAGPPAAYAELYCPLLAMLGHSSEIPHRKYVAQVLLVLHALLSHSTLAVMLEPPAQSLIENVVNVKEENWLKAIAEAASSFVSTEHSSAASHVLEMALNVVQGGAGRTSEAATVAGRRSLLLTNIQQRNRYPSRFPHAPGDALNISRVFVHSELADSEVSPGRRRDLASLHALQTICTSLNHNIAVATPEGSPSLPDDSKNAGAQTRKTHGATRLPDDPGEPTGPEHGLWLLYPVAIPMVQHVSEPNSIETESGGADHTEQLLADERAALQRAWKKTLIGKVFSQPSAAWVAQRSKLASP